MTSATETLSYRIAGRRFPIPRAYTFHNGGGTAAMVLTAIRTSRRVARSSVSRPEWSIRDRRNHQLPLPGIDDAQARFAKLWKEYGLPSRSDERRGGKECVSTCRSRWSPDNKKKKKKTKSN